MKTRFLLTTVTAGLLGLGAAHAMPSTNTGALFDSLDKNGDDQLNAEELGNLPDVMARKRFDQADVDGNGKISKTEYTVKAKQRAVKLFSRLDKNDDDTLSQDEVMSEHDKLRHGAKDHGHHDKKDHDVEKSADSMSGKDKSECKSSRKDKKGMDADAWMNKLDENGDDKISREEWTDGMQHHAKKRDDAGSNSPKDSGMDSDSAMSDDDSMSADETSDGSRMDDEADASSDMEMSEDSGMSDESN